MDTHVRFECGACHALHEHFTLAQQCCLPLVFPVHFCGKCKSKHGTHQAADACCRPLVAAAVRDHSALAYGD